MRSLLLASPPFDGKLTLFKIKICGIASVQDARVTALAGADAIGLNFYPPSSRHVTEEMAAEIAAVLPDRVQKVGVFVNSEVGQVRQTAESLALDYVQLHGDEPPEVIAELDGISVIRALRLGDDLAHVTDYLDKCSSLRMPEAVLLDASVDGEYGGTGTEIDFAAAAQARETIADVPVVLAGGLTPFNVTDAITTVRPTSVDVASGVESSAPTKDPMLVRAFVMSAKKAFASLDEA